jgi:peptidoglycan/LPS O-acetylase OafA/YrhL
VVGQLVQMVVRSLQMMLAARSWPRWSFQRRAFQELLHFSAGQSAANLANYLATNGDNLVVGKFLGAAPMGIYSRAYQLMLAPAMLVGSVLEKVLFPVLSKVQQEPALLKRAYRQSNHLLAVSILPVAVAIYLLAPDAIPVALGAKWAGVVLPLQLFSIGLLWRVGMKVSNSIIRACAAVRIFAICQICYAVSVVLCAWVGSRGGIPGVCVGVLVAIFGCYAFAAVICFRLSGLRLGEFLVDHVPGTALGGLVAVTGWLLRSWLHAMHTRSIPSLAITAGGMGVTVTVAVAIFPRFLLGVYGEKLKAKLRLTFSRKRFPDRSAPATGYVTLDGNYAPHRLETLDTFRGLAAFGVMIYHYCLRYGEIVSPNPNQVPEGHGLFLQLVFPWFFFVISGFVIFMTLSRTKNEVDFLVSRFSRLYPAYWAAVVLTFTVMAVFPLAGRTYPLQVGAINLTMLQGWLLQPNIDGVYWTLMIELSFYALMYLLFRLKQLKRIESIGSAWLIVQCTVAIGQRALHHRLPSVVSNTLLLSWFQFFFAGVLFYHLRTYGFTWFRLLILALCVLTQGIVYESPTAAGEAFVFFILFVLFLYDRLHFLCNRPLLYLGAISYPLYLIHQNIGYTTIQHLSSLGAPRWAGLLVACAVSLSLASLLTFSVEKPALRAIRSRYRQYQARNDQLTAVVAPSGSMLH